MMTVGLCRGVSSAPDERIMTFFFQRVFQARQLWLRGLFVLAVALNLALATGCSRSREDLERDPVPGRVTYYGVAERIRGFDPVLAGDVASALAISRIYEGLLQYAYLDRPYRVEPCLAVGMPEVTLDGLTYTFRVRQGIYFQDDPCFKATGGKGRELTADDFVFALKRIADLKTGSTGYWAFNNRVVGMDDFRVASGKDSATDYDRPVAGLQAPDRYTFRIQLTQPYPQLIWILAMHYTYAIPREALAYYGKDLVNHPVGTGPYCLKSWKRNYRLEYVRNPKWAETGRIERYPTQGALEDVASGLLADAGKPLPRIDRVVQYVISDTSTLWLMFLSGRLESSGISRDNWDAVVTRDKALNRQLMDMGIHMYATPVMETFYIGFNMDDPVVGSNKKLRQAMTCAFNSDDYVRFYNHRVVRAKGPIPPGVAGYDECPSPFPFDLARAKRLLAESGYPDGKDPKTGRRLKLTLELGNANDPELRASVEMFVGFMAGIGIVIDPSYNSWPAFLERVERRQAQMFRLGWVADYPDAENFLQLFYGPNASPGPNHANYSNKSFDALYEQVRVMQDAPERTELYRQMAAVVMEDCPWLFEQHPMVYGLHHRWLKNYKPHDFPYGMSKYHTVDGEDRRQWKDTVGRSNGL